MKILIIHLHRLGDIIQTLVVIDRIKHQIHPPVALLKQEISALAKQLASGF